MQGANALWGRERGRADAFAAAEVFTAVVRNPFEVVKQQMQAGMHASTPDAIRSLLRAEGVRGFYAGYLTLVAREIPFDAMQFTLYEFLKSSWARTVGRDLALTDNAVLGCAVQRARSGPNPHMATHTRPPASAGASPAESPPR